MIINKFKAFLESRQPGDLNHIEVSTGILSVFDSDKFDPERVLYPGDDDEQYGVDGYWHHFDSEKYWGKVLGLAVPFITKKLRDTVLGLNIGVEDIVFKSTEEGKSDTQFLHYILYDFVMEEGWQETIEEYIHGIKPQPLDAYLQGEWGHAEGFVSYMPQDKHDLIKFLRHPDERKRERGVATFLLYLIGKKQIKQWNKELRSQTEHWDADEYWNGDWDALNNEMGSLDDDDEDDSLHDTDDIDNMSDEEIADMEND